MVQVCSSRTENTQFNDFTKHSDDAVSTLDRSKDEDQTRSRNSKTIGREEIVETFTENREKIREEAKRNILKMQEENCRNFNKKRKKAYQYEIGDIVAIQRTQFGTGLKLRPKFFGPYEVVKVKPKDRYDVRKIGLHEGQYCIHSSEPHEDGRGEASA
ncbi:retrovirus-related Pol polyprotein from transposon 17.6 [Trichonephila clavipes]|nr:retrovirus-related Pol polyprotein from transposon 17.6 [Trichonephila clavipes]